MGLSNVIASAISSSRPCFCLIFYQISKIRSEVRGRNNKIILKLKGLFVKCEQGVTNIKRENIKALLESEM